MHYISRSLVLLLLLSLLLAFNMASALPRAVGGDDDDFPEDNDDFPEDGGNTTTPGPVIAVPEDPAIRLPLHTAPPNFSSCGSSSDLFDLRDLSISPFPPKAGKNIVVSAGGILKDVVQKGSKFFVKAKLGIITVLDQTVDLCAADTSGSCPIQPANSPTTITFAYPIPSGTPGFQVNLQLVAKNPDGKQIFCFSGPIKVEK